MNDGPKRDWEKTWIHFFCGAILGAGLGFYFSPDPSEHNFWPTGAVFMVGGATIIGFLAAFFLDRFWETFVEWFSRW